MIKRKVYRRGGLSAAKINSTTCSPLKLEAGVATETSNVVRFQQCEVSIRVPGFPLVSATPDHDSRAETVPEMASTRQI